MALNQSDFAAVISDPAKVRDNIGRGLRIIQLIGNSPSGVKVQQSEKILNKLIGATLRGKQKVGFSFSSSHHQI